MAHTHHAIDYIEFGVINLEDAKRFYNQAFGWQFNDYGPGYAGIQHPSGEGEVGGLAQTDAPAVGGPLVILYSDELSASRAQVQASGGRISKEIFEFPGGRRFHFCDPSGNELAVWSKA